MQFSLLEVLGKLCCQKFYYYYYYYIQIRGCKTVVEENKNKIYKVSTKNRCGNIR